jgi:zinc transporter ZupT
VTAFGQVESVGDRYANVVALFTFFSGVVLMAALDALVHRLDPETELHEPDLAGDFAAHHINVVDHVLCAEFRDAGATAEDDELHEAHAARIRGAAESKRLKRMGLMTGLCILLHNFPEGLATFVGALANTTLGVGLAVAIGVHNLPEGICVAVPIYYATGSRWKGFAAAFVSGLAEPVGAVLGYAVLASVVGQLAYGILFGIIAGMMVFISFHELLPTAQRYDGHGHVTTVALFVGMFVIALSLVLFTL